jgi:DMSO/TMAO reductase YedYZ molybdopterin-dependent catalytic subunit
MIINEGFLPKRAISNRLPPGQYESKDFPVLSLGPTPDIDLATWRFEVAGLVARPKVWNWQEFGTLPHESVKKDIHCVTKWSKFDTTWSGVSLDYLIKECDVDLDQVTHVIAHSYDGYSTNLPIEDVTGGRAMIATAYEGEPIEA